MKIGGRLQLDRMTIEEAGPDPRRLAAAIHAQLPDHAGPVPVHDIAYSLDIVAIRAEPAKGFEAALVAPAERGDGAILVNEKSSYRRQRYSIGHELCHFLNPAHQPTSSMGRFACTSRDLSATWLSTGGSSDPDDRHIRQETEANLFAIELLAPAHLCLPHLGDEPNLGSVVVMANSLDLSKEASARRYVGLHRQASAMVFSKYDVVRYVERGMYFPAISRRKGKSLGNVPAANGLSGLSDRIVVDPSSWLQGRTSAKLTIQTLHQQGGYAMTLLTLGHTGQL